MAKTTIRNRFSVRQRRFFKYAIPILAVLAIGCGVYAVNHKATTPIRTTSHGSSPHSQIDYSPAPKADNTPNNTRKSSPTPSSTLENYQPPPNTGSFNVSITRAGVENQSLQVAAITRGITTGTCTLNVYQTGQSTISQSEQLSLEVNSYVCPAFSLPLSEFPNRGQWNVSMTVESGGQTVTADWSQNPVTLQ